MKRVVRLTETELTKLIKRIIVEAEMEKEEMGGGEVEEGMFSWLKRSMGDRDDLERSLRIKMRNYEYMTGKDISREEKQQLRDDLLAQAENDDWAGTFQFKGKQGDSELVYLTSKEAEDRGGSVTSIAR